MGDLKTQELFVKVDEDIIVPCTENFPAAVEVIQRLTVCSHCT